jgi:hypothetical protein
MQLDTYGLSTILISVLQKILPISPQDLSQFEEKTNYLLAHYSPSYDFQPIYTFFRYPMIPKCFSSLFALALVSPSSFSANTKSPVAISVQGIISYHLLCILGNLFTQHNILDELVKFNQLQSLMKILSLKHSQGADFGLLIVHKQLIRTLCKLTATVCRDVKQIYTLKDQVIKKIA